MSRLTAAIGYTIGLVCAGIGVGAITGVIQSAAEQNWAGLAITLALSAAGIGGGGLILWSDRPIQAHSWYVVRNGYVTGTIDHEGDGNYRARSRKQEARALGRSRSVIGAWLLIVRHQRAVRLDRKCRNCGCNR